MENRILSSRTKMPYKFKYVHMTIMFIIMKSALTTSSIRQIELLSITKLNDDTIKQITNNISENNGNDNVHLKKYFKHSSLEPTLMVTKGQTNIKHMDIIDMKLEEGLSRNETITNETPTITTTNTTTATTATTIRTTEILSSTSMTPKTDELETEYMTSSKKKLILTSWSLDRVGKHEPASEVPAINHGSSSEPPQLPISDDLLELRLHSSKYFAQYFSDVMNVFVERQPPWADSERVTDGFWITIVHEGTGKLLEDSIHLQPWGDLCKIKTLLDTVQSGRIVNIMTKGDITHVIPSVIRSYLEDLGSSFIQVLGRGITWSWMFVKGGRTFLETVTMPTTEGRVATTHHTNTVVHPHHTTDYCSEWANDSHWELRRKFCSTYEFYGDLCSCDNPRDMSTLTAQRIENSQLNKAVIVIIAHRVPSLYRSLKSLMTAQGFSSERLEVFTQDPHAELSAFVELMGLRLTVTHQESEYINSNIAKQYIFGFDYVLGKYLDADFIIALEEDIAVSPDFFVFLNRSAPLLHNDPSLYCATAHNDLTFPINSYDPTKVIRTESINDYGWMVKRDFAVNMTTAMRNISHPFDWDMFTYYYIRGNRECIVPEVSRSHHFGNAGSHISQFDDRMFFSIKNYNLDSNATVQGLDMLYADVYEHEIETMLKGAHFINVSVINPCDEDFYDRFNVILDDVLVIVFEQNVNVSQFRNSEHWDALASCLGTFSIESREHHKGLYRLRYGPAQLLLLAYPASPYSKYVPTNASVFVATEKVQLAAFHKGYGRYPEMPYTDTLYTNNWRRIFT